MKLHLLTNYVEEYRVQIVPLLSKMLKEISNKQNKTLKKVLLYNQWLHNQKHAKSECAADLLMSI